MSLLENGLIVSCMALDRDPADVYSSSFVKGMCFAAQHGGAAALKLSDTQLIKSLKQEKIKIPIIGVKKLSIDNQVRITPDFESAKQVLDSDADIISIQVIESDELFSLSGISDLIDKVKKEYKKPIIAAVSNVNEGIIAEEMGVDYIATTLAGYTRNSRKISQPDYELIIELKNSVKLPIIAEGRYETPEAAKKAIELGASSVVVGTAITRPHIIAKNFKEQVCKG